MTGRRARQNPAGVVAVDPTTLVSASGNSWILGLIEES